MNINAFIKNQKLRIPRKEWVAGSRDYVEVNIVFQTGDWVGLDVTAFFASATDLSNPYVIKVKGNRILANQHLNLTAGEWKIWFVGLDLDGTQKITTTVESINVKPTGCSCDDFPAIEPSYAEQIVRDAERALRVAESVRDDADSGSFDGGYYTVTVTAEGQDLVFSYAPVKPGMTVIQPQRVKVAVPGVTPEEVAKAVEAYLLKHPVQAPVQSVNGQTGVVKIKAVQYDAQKLTEAEKEQARRNIDAGSVADISGQVTAAQTAAREAGQSASNAAGSASTANAAAGRAETAERGANSAAETARGHADNAAQSAQTASTEAGNATQSATTATEQASAAAGSAATATSEADRAKREADRAEQAEGKPTKLATLTFTGAANATYDGTVPKTINIPEGGTAPGGSSAEWEDILIKKYEASAEIPIAEIIEETGNLKKYAELIIAWEGASGTSKGAVVKFNGITVESKSQSFKAYLTAPITSYWPLGQVPLITCYTGFCVYGEFYPTNPGGVKAEHKNIRYEPKNVPIDGKIEVSLNTPLETGFVALYIRGRGVVKNV